MKLTEKQISSQLIYEGKVLNLRKDRVELENGNTSYREIIQNKNACCVVAVDDNENILLVDQFRYAIGRVVTELPAGKMDDGESKEDCCRRELLEETGYIAETIEYVGKFYPSVAYLTEELYVFFAKVKRESSQNLDDDEFVNIKLVPLSKVYQQVLSGEIEDSKTQIGILKYVAMKKNGIV